MKKVDALCFYPQKASELLQTLRKILLSCCQPSFDLAEETLPIGFPQHLRTTPDLILVILDDYPFRETERLFQFIRCQCPPRPVLVVTEDVKPDDVFQLLRL